MPHALSTLLRVIEKFCVLLMVLLVALSALQVLMRKMSSPLVWSNDLTALLLVWVSLLGAVLVQADREHVRVDFLTNALGQGAQKLLSIGWKLAVIAMLVTMIFVSPDILRASTNTFPSTLPISMVWYRLAVVVMAMVGCAVLAGQILEDWAGATDASKEHVE